MTRIAFINEAQFKQMQQTLIEDELRDLGGQERVLNDGYCSETDTKSVFETILLSTLHSSGAVPLTKDKSAEELAKQKTKTYNSIKEFLDEVIKKSGIYWNICYSRASTTALTLYANTAILKANEILDL